MKNVKSTTKKKIVQLERSLHGSEMKVIEVGK
jgi:hypothetical protein